MGDMSIKGRIYRNVQKILGLFRRMLTDYFREIFDIIFDINICKRNGIGKFIWA